MDTVLGTSMRRSTADICWSMEGSLCRLDDATSCRRDVAAASLPLFPATTETHMVSADAGHLAPLIHGRCGSLISHSVISTVQCADGRGLTTPSKLDSSNRQSARLSRGRAGAHLHPRLTPHWHAGASLCAQWRACAAAGSLGQHPCPPLGPQSCLHNGNDSNMATDIPAPGLCTEGYCCLRRPGRGGCSSAMLWQYSVRRARQGGLLHCAAAVLPLPHKAVQPWLR